MCSHACNLIMGYTSGRENNLFCHTRYGRIIDSSTAQTLCLPCHRCARGRRHMPQAACKGLYAPYVDARSIAYPPIPVECRRMGLKYSRDHTAGLVTDPIQGLQKIRYGRSRCQDVYHWSRLSANPGEWHYTIVRYDHNHQW